jgi:cytochrome c oxidase cbb3-type subunit III
MKRSLFLIPTILFVGCGNRIEQYTLPDQITDFTALYGSNCAGCHGQDGRLGAARPLNDPVFLAVIGKETLRQTIANGVPQTAMPPFAQSHGGGLTDQQIGILADQIEARWAHPQDFAGVALPPYSAGLGDAKSGAAVFSAYCATCHGEGDAVVVPSFLELVSDQSLRTTVIAGRADFGSPDWRHDSPSHTLTPQEISDVVAWIAAHRAPITLTEAANKPLVGQPVLPAAIPTNPVTGRRPSNAPSGGKLP